MRRAVCFLFFASPLLAMVPTAAAGPVPAVKPPDSKQRLLQSLEELGGATTRADIRRLVAVQMQLEQRIPAEQLAPHFVPLLFHPASRVRQVAGRVLRQSGPKGHQVAFAAFHMRFQSVKIDIKKLVRSAGRADDTTSRLLELIYYDRKKYGSETRIALVTGLARRGVSTPSAQRIYRRALLDGELNSAKAKLSRLRVMSAVVPTKILADRVFLPMLASKEESHVRRALSVLSRYPDPPPSIITAMTNQLANPSERIVRHAFWALIRCAKWADVEPTYQLFARSKDVKLRRRAMEMLDAFDPDTPASVRAVRSALEFATNAWERRELLTKLVQLAPTEPATIRKLADIVARDESDSVRWVAISALSSAGVKARDAAKEVYAALEKATDYRMKLKIVQTLQRIHPPKANVQTVLRKMEGELIKNRVTTLMQSILREQQKLMQDTRRLNVESILGDVNTRK